MIKQPTNFMVFPKFSRCLMVSAAEKSWTRGSPPNEQFQVFEIPKNWWDDPDIAGLGCSLEIDGIQCVYPTFKIFQEICSSNRITTPCSNIFFVCEGRYNLPSEYIRNSVLVLLSSQAVVRQNTVHTSSYAARFEVQLGLGLGIGSRKQNKAMEEKHQFSFCPKKLVKIIRKSMNPLSLRSGSGGSTSQNLEMLNQRTGLRCVTSSSSVPIILVFFCLMSSYIIPTLYPPDIPRIHSNTSRLLQS